MAIDLKRFLPQFGQASSPAYFPKFNFDPRTIQQPEQPELGMQLDQTFRRNRIPTPEIGSPAMDAYMGHINRMPTRENPNWWTRIAAALSGASAGYQNPIAGIEAARNVREYPYQQKLDDWSNKLKPLASAANIEGQNVGRYLSSRDRQDALTSREDIAGLTNDTKLALGRMNADNVAAKLKAASANVKSVVTDEQGNMFAVTNDGNTVDLGINSYGKKEEVDAKIEGMLKAHRIDAAARMYGSDVSRANNQDTNATRVQTATTTGEQPVSAAQQGIWNQQDLAALAAERPDLVTSGVIIKDPENQQLALAPQKQRGMFGSLFGLEDKSDKYTEAYNLLKQKESARKVPTRPTKTTRNTTTSSSGSTRTPVVNRPTVPGNSRPVTFMVPGKGTATVPANEVADFLKEFPNAVRQ